MKKRRVPNETKFFVEKLRLTKVIKIMKIIKIIKIQNVMEQTTKYLYIN